MERSVTYQNSNLNYAVSGQGTRSILLFHGFGQDHKAFNSLSNALQHDYTIYAFDLYFHGKSVWHYDEMPLEKDFWRAVMDKFLEDNHINKFSLAGFSLGCRFALATVELFPDKVEKLYLLAPDGIKTSFWFTISTYPILIRRIFKSMIHRPDRFKKIARVLSKLNLVDKGLIKFAEYQMDTESRRRKVYYSWVVFRHLKFNVRNLIKLINGKKIPVTIVVGREDRVISFASMKWLVKQINKSRLEILDIGHVRLLTNPLLVNTFKASEVQ